MYALRLKKDMADESSVPGLEAILAREAGNTGMVYLYRLGGTLMCFERSACIVLSLCNMETAFRVSEEGYADYLACVVSDVEGLRKAGLKLSGVGANEISLETGIVCGGYDLLLRSLNPLDKDSRYLELLRGLRSGSPGQDEETQKWNKAMELYGKKKKREQPVAGDPSLLSSGAVLSGDLHLSEDLHIDGRVEGSIYSEKAVTVGPGGNVDGNIIAATVDIHGCVLGTVTAGGSACLRKGCMLKGDLIAGSVEIEPGARFEGQCRMGSGLECSPVVYRDQNLLT
ncbi:bactofilin family protein [Dysgonomonas termitidis]